MRGILANDQLGENPTIAGNQRGAGIVARRLEAKDHSHFATGPLPESGAVR
jgi:hypothetical protein